MGAGAGGEGREASGYALFTEKLTFQRRLEEVRALATWMPRGRAFQKKGTACVKAGRQKCVCLVPSTAKSGWARAAGRRSRSTFQAMVSSGSHSEKLESH